MNERASPLTEYDYEEEWDGVPTSWTPSYWGRTKEEVEAVAKVLGLTEEERSQEFWYIDHVDEDKKYLTDPEYRRVYSEAKLKMIADSIERDQARPWRLNICSDYETSIDVVNITNWHENRGIPCPLLCTHETNYEHAQRECEGCTRCHTQIRGPDHFDYGDHFVSRARSNFDSVEGLWAEDRE